MNYVITGGSRGIGESIVLQAVTEGHNVAFTYLGSEEMSQAVVAKAAEINADAKCKCYRLDQRDSAEVERVGDEILDEFEDIQVLVNNAGITRDNLAVSMSDEEWHDVIGTNLHGPFFMARQFLTNMIMNRYGRIINLSSVSQFGASGQCNYAASKAGLKGLTRALAKEYGRKGITANLVMPGFFETPMTQETMSDAFKDFWMNFCPVRRPGDVSEISQVVTFLGSEAASFINGAEIPVTGGLEFAP